MTGPPADPSVTRIAAGVDGLPEGEDAAALAGALARATGAEPMLVAVHANPMVPVPAELSWKGMHAQTQAMLRRVRDDHAPGARIEVQTDHSVARALQRVALEHHRDLLVVGSSRHGLPGRVRIGKRTRQLLCHFERPLAVAPRGWRARGERALGTIGVGYDGEAESAAALGLAGSIARRAGAELRVCGVIDDRIPLLLRSPTGERLIPEWQEVIAEEQTGLERRIDKATSGLGVRSTSQVTRGRPADALLKLSEQVDLLVIGSRRWGPVERVLLGSTGEALLHDAACPVLTVPRPDA